MNASIRYANAKAELIKKKVNFRELTYPYAVIESRSDNRCLPCGSGKALVSDENYYTKSVVNLETGQTIRTALLDQQGRYLMVRELDQKKIEGIWVDKNVLVYNYEEINGQMNLLNKTYISRSNIRVMRRGHKTSTV